MARRGKNKYLPTIVLIASVLFMGVMLLITETAVQRYKSNYFDKKETYDFVDAKATKLGTTYQGYTAQEGTELYKIDYTIRNDGVTNQEYFSVYFDYTEPMLRNSNYTDDVAYHFKDSSLAVVPASMQGNGYTVLEVPKGITAVEAYSYLDSGEISLTIPLDSN